MSNNQQQNSTSTRSQPSMAILPVSTESLLFNDIVEEKCLALRNALEEFLKTQPYGKFDSEFSSFLSRIKRIGSVEPNVNTSVSRSTSVSGSNPSNSRSEPISNTPNASRSTSTHESNSVNSRSHPITNTSNAEPNPFRPHSDNISGHRTIVISKHVENLLLKRLSLSNSTASNINNASSQVNPNPNSSQLSKNSSASISTSNNRNNSNASQVTRNQLNSTVNEEKYLYKWRVKMEERKPKGGPSTCILKLSGVLLTKDLITVLEDVHCAGILKCRKNKNLVQTDKGLYKLIGPIDGGLPKTLFGECVSNGGIPRLWRNLLKQISSLRKRTNVPVNLDKSFTRSGTDFKKKKNTPSGGQKLNKKRKCSEGEESNSKKMKNDNLQNQLSIASTSKKFNRINTPAQYLKYKFHQKFVKTCSLINKTAEKI